MKVELKELVQVKPYWRNPRKNDKTVEALKDSIRKFGFQVPIIVDTEGVIVTGHARYRAVTQLKGELDQEISMLRDTAKNVKEEKDAKRLESLAENLTNVNEGKVPVRVAVDLSEKQAKEFRIADNRLPELTSWDEDALRSEMRELQDVVGFTAKEIEKILADDNLEYEAYSQDEIDKQGEALKDAFSDRATDYNNDLVGVTCPHCTKEFQISKKEVNTSKWL